MKLYVCEKIRYFFFDFNSFCDYFCDFVLVVNTSAF